MNVAISQKNKYTLQFHMFSHQSKMLQINTKKVKKKLKTDSVHYIPLFQTTKSVVDVFLKVSVRQNVFPSSRFE